MKFQKEELFKNRQGLEHPTALFYFAISKFELQQFEEAIVLFDKCLKLYPTLSEAKFYKAFCMLSLGKKDEAEKLISEAKTTLKQVIF